MKMMREMLKMKTSLGCEKGKRSQVIMTLFVAVDIPYHVTSCICTSTGTEKPSSMNSNFFSPKYVLIFFWKLIIKKNSPEKKKM